MNSSVWAQLNQYSAITWFFWYHVEESSNYPQKLFTCLSQRFVIDYDLVCGLLFWDYVMYMQQQIEYYPLKDLISWLIKSITFVSLEFLYLIIWRLPSFLAFILEEFICCLSERYFVEVLHRTNIWYHTS